MSMEIVAIERWKHNPQKVIEIMQARIEKHAHQVRVYNAIKQAVKPFDGKVCTMRMVNAVKAALPDYMVGSYGYNWHGVTVYGNGLDYGFSSVHVLFSQSREKGVRLDWSQIDNINPTTYTDPNVEDNIRAFIARAPEMVRRWNWAIHDMQKVYRFASDHGASGIFGEKEDYLKR